MDFEGLPQVALDLRGGQRAILGKRTDRVEAIERRMVHFRRDAEASQEAEADVLLKRQFWTYEIIRVIG
jgi:hypothetical protein